MHYFTGFSPLWLCGVKLDAGTKTTIFDYNTDFAIFVSSISQICQFLIFFRL